MDLEASASAPHGNLNEFVEKTGKILLPELAEEIKKMSIRLDSIYFETRHAHLPFGSRNAYASYLATVHHNISPGLAEKETTACREVPIFDSSPNSDDESNSSFANDLSLTITSML